MPLDPQDGHVVVGAVVSQVAQDAGDEPFERMARRWRRSAEALETHLDRLSSPFDQSVRETQEDRSWRRRDLDGRVPGLAGHTDGHSNGRRGQLSEMGIGEKRRRMAGIRQSDPVRRHVDMGTQDGSEVAILLNARPGPTTWTG